MKVSEYIERCKKEIGWDDEAEKDWIKMSKASELLFELAPFIDRTINLLKIKIDLGMAGSVDIEQYEQLKKIMPGVLGDKKDD